MPARLETQEAKGRDATVDLVTPVTCSAPFRGFQRRVFFATIAIATANLGCTSSDSARAIDTGGGGGTTSITHPDQAPLAGESACTVTTRIGIVEGAPNHVPICTPIDYATNPPSGGPHWPIWAAFANYAMPVPHEMYVHDLEHGAVVFTYRCADGCPDVVSALEGVIAAFPADPLCSGEGTNARTVLTPDPALDVPIAASAWGATYTATCLDVASLTSFAAAVYGKGPEVLCAPGEAVGDVVAGCPGIE